MIGTGMTGGGGGGTRTGPFFGESHVPMSILCFPGTIGGGGIPGPFFLSVDDDELVRSVGFAGCDAIEAQVIFLGTEATCVSALARLLEFDSLTVRELELSSPMLCIPL